MKTAVDDISRFYLTHLGGEWQETFSVACPFCLERGFPQGKLVVVLQRESFFYGYFRCLNRCVPGGYPLWFAKLAGIPLADVPGYDVERQDAQSQVEYPQDNINEEVHGFAELLPENIRDRFHQATISTATLTELQVGYNGRYLVYPYFQEDGNCYSARCVHPDKPDDYFWHGSEAFTSYPHDLFNRQDVQRCDNGAMFLCEGEENLLALRQLGFPGVAVVSGNDFEKVAATLFARITTLFICFTNCPESETSARVLAARIGYKARLLQWPAGTPINCNLLRLARQQGREFRSRVATMVKTSRAFSPFSSPTREYRNFLVELRRPQSEQYSRLLTGFPLFDEALGGVHGINVIGGAPKVGKSTFMIQIAAEMARRKIPVLYYDFENGRQKIYLRTLCRLSRLPAALLSAFEKNDDEGFAERQEAMVSLEKMMVYWRIVNDRKITPELMRKHIEFIRHDTRSEYTVVIIDSLHKLPFNEFTEQRTGIDAWLRQMETIRDDLHVSFLVISELTRGEEGSYDGQPHLGVFKGSGDIEYSADNAMVLYPAAGSGGAGERVNSLWLVASREHPPGLVANYRVDYPYWGFKECPAQG
jgi:KaiC/GvpD/RAD55 family RecA-like ATPase